MNEKLNKILESLSYEEKDLLYRKLWYDYVLEDVKEVIEDSDISIKNPDKIAKEIARKYVYDGDYDCELSYWNNIEILLQKEVNEYGI